MTWEFDSFRINWTERSKDRIVTSVTGYSYQVASWKSDYFSEYSPKSYNTRVLTTVDDKRGMVTMTVSRNSLYKNR
jgi:hypothetical protein